jgi:hypothetical protein
MYYSNSFYSKKEENKMNHIQYQLLNGDEDIRIEKKNGTEIYLFDPYNPLK